MDGGGGPRGKGSGGVQGLRFRGGKWQGHGPQRSKFRNVCRIFVVFNAYKKKKNGFFGRMPRGVGGGTHRSWPGGWGGRPRALIPRGRGQGRVGLADQGLVDRRGKGSGGGARASVPGG